MATGRALFPGGNTNDQLIHIFRILGTPTPESWNGVTAFPEWSDDFPSYRGKDLKKVVPNLDPNGHDILIVFPFPPLLFVYFSIY